jgi:hypothetical protein
MLRRLPSLAIAALVLALIATLSRAIREPNAFAKASWLLDYRFGFMKRALQGSVLVFLSRVGVLHLRKDTIIAVTFIVFALLCAAMLTMALRTLSRDRWSTPTFAVMASFFTSAYVLSAGHLMGYLDHIVALLSVVAIWCAMRERYWTAALVVTAGVLVHETVYFIGVPVLLMTIALHPRVRAAGASAWRRLVPALAPLVIPVIAGAAIVLSEQDPVRRMALRGNLVRRLSAFPWITGDMNLLLPEWLTTRFVDHFQEEAHAFPSRITSPGYVLYVIPGAFLLWLLASALSSWRRDWMAAAAIAILLPLLLHLLAFDTARQWAYPLYVGLMCVWMSSCVHDGRARWGPFSRATALVLAAAVVACNIFVMRYPLLDYQVDKFTNAQRLLFYAPFIALAAAFVWLNRRAAADPEGT